MSGEPRGRVGAPAAALQRQLPMKRFISKKLLRVFNSQQEQSSLPRRDVTPPDKTGSTVWGFKNSRWFFFFFFKCKAAGEALLLTRRRVQVVAAAGRLVAGAGGGGAAGGRGGPSGSEEQLLP